MRKKNVFDNFSNLGALRQDGREFEVAQEIVECKDILAEETEKPSFRFFYVAGGILCLILVLKLLNLQITHGLGNRTLADRNRISTRKVEPVRGIVTDANGKPLVRNVPSYALEIYPADLPRINNDRQKVYEYVNKLTKIPIDEIKKAEKNGLASMDPVTIKDDIERNQALVWEAQLTDTQGVVIAKRPRREYDSVVAMSHIMGWVGLVSEEDLKNTGYSSASRIGKVGVEYVYEKELRGTAGAEVVEKDAKGRVQRTLSYQEPISGNNIVLSIDNDLQKYMAKVLQEQMKTINRTKGVAIAMNPQNGEILGMVSIPYYDNNMFARGIKAKEYKELISDKNFPMNNRAISGVYPSGSVIKPMVATAALEEKVISEYTSLDTSVGAIKIGQWVFPDWKVHGWTDVRRAIAESNDIFFYALGGGWDKIKGLGITKLSNWYKKFGFGEKTGVDLTNEVDGLVPDREWKKKTLNEGWYIGDTYHMAIGQGYFLTTPLQLLNATAAIANGGELLQPKVCSRIVDSSGTIIQRMGKIVLNKQVASKHGVQVAREGMRQTVVSGSAGMLRDLSVEAAAKTGTAQYGDNTNSHAWFSAFAPYNNPQIALVVMIEGGGEGSRQSQPVAKKILQYYFSKK